MPSTVNHPGPFLQLNKLVLSGSTAGKGQSRLGDDHERLRPAGGRARAQGISCPRLVFFLIGSLPPLRTGVFRKCLFGPLFIRSLPNPWTGLDSPAMSYPGTLRFASYHMGHAAEIT